jgi:hypothetical protein
VVMPCSRRRFLLWGTNSGLSLLLVASAAGCGTLLYPERRGQRSGRLDWRVVMLNGIGLFFFFIPGVIAFAVDFVNGTIYLPPECVDCEPEVTSKSSPTLRKVPISRDDLNPPGIQRVLSRETGREIRFDNQVCMTKELKSLSEFWTVRRSLIEPTEDSITDNA